MKGEPAEVNELNPVAKPLQAVVQLGKELKDLIKILIIGDWQFINIRLTNNKKKTDDDWCSL